MNKCHVSFRWISYVWKHWSRIVKKRQRCFQDYNHQLPWILFNLLPRGVRHLPAAGMKSSRRDKRFRSKQPVYLGTVAAAAPPTCSAVSKHKGEALYLLTVSGHSSIPPKNPLSTRMWFYIHALTRNYQTSSSVSRNVLCCFCWQSADVSNIRNRITVKI